jgi:hypothetical protein
VGRQLQQWSIPWGVAFLGVLDEVPHESGGDRLPPHGLAFLPQQDQAQGTTRFWTTRFRPGLRASSCATCRISNRALSGPRCAASTCVSRRARSRSWPVIRAAANPRWPCWPPGCSPWPPGGPTRISALPAAGDELGHALTSRVASRAAVTLVPQDTVLFNTSIRENLPFARLPAVPLAGQRTRSEEVPRHWTRVTWPTPTQPTPVRPACLSAVLQDDDGGGLRPGALEAGISVMMHSGLRHIQRLDQSGYWPPVLGGPSPDAGCPVAAASPSSRQLRHGGICAKNWRVVTSPPG